VQRWQRRTTAANIDVNHDDDLGHHHDPPAAHDHPVDDSTDSPTNAVQPDLAGWQSLPTR
jgi:hypothetical protein